MAIGKGMLAVATILEAGMVHSDVRNHLQSALGNGCYYVDHDGDGATGNCVYSSYQNGSEGLQRAPYTIGTANGKASANIDKASAQKVIPSTTYAAQADDDDQYAGMEEAFRAANIYTDLPVYERFIAKSERDQADAGSFAGKGKSYPILKPEDVSAAVHAMGRAGSGNYGVAQLKANIVKIAKAKGWGSHLPKEWQECMDEAADIAIDGEFVALKEGAVGQDGTAYLKLIAPGHGSSGYYSTEVLKRDGPKVFKKGTKNFWNHPTDAEEAARPEGDLRDLASVLTEDAHYEENGSAGAGLYAKAEVQPAFRSSVDSLAKHIGMSIRASGKAREGVAPDGKKCPIIEQLTRATSVDYVTEPGAGGKILQLFEAARGPRQSQQEEDPMDAATLREVQDLKAEVRKLRERTATADAAGAIAQYFTTVRVGEAIQERVTRRLLERAVPLTADGGLDITALNKLAEAETKEEAAYVSRLTGHQVVVGMGSAPAATLTEAQKSELTERRKQTDRQLAEVFGFRPGQKKARRILAEGRRAFDPHYNSAKVLTSGVTVVDAGEAA